MEMGRVKEGDGGINYHKKTGINMSSMVGDSNPWCASFVIIALKNLGIQHLVAPVLNLSRKIKVL
ncbi:chitinase, class I [Klebsiella pneumoniae subsp. pneumoniae]|nr:chitinase, class I [Klebsiella pneumoniae subsp. pneumoniae]